MTTVRQLLSDVLQDIGYLGVGDVFQAEDAQFALRLVNQWLNALTLEPMALFYVLRTVKALAANGATLTIGTGGQINIVRPDHVEHAGLIINASAVPPTEIPIHVFTDQEWQGIPQKTLTSPYVQGVYYDRNYVAGLATLSLFPVPTIGTTQLVLYTLQGLTSFTLDDTVSFPNGYEQMFRSSWAVRLSPSFGKSATQDQVQQAKLDKGLVKRANVRPVQSTLDPRTPGLHPGYGYDWRTDTFHGGGAA